LWTSVVLPPMKNLCSADSGYFRYEDRPADIRDLNPCEGTMINPELHYRRKEFEAIGDFDVALMAESFPIHGVDSRRLIFSRHFRDFVVNELRLPFSGVPVRLDDHDDIPWAGPYPGPWEHLNQRPEWLKQLK
jgi:hypothetical protein